MSAAADARGLKRVCVECGIRFYDMNKRPITCPSCNTEFTGAVVAKGKRAKIEPVKEAAKPEVETEEAAPGDDDNISLDEAQAMEEGDNDDDEDSVDLEPLDIDELDDEDLDDLDAVEEDDD